MFLKYFFIGICLQSLKEIVRYVAHRFHYSQYNSLHKIPLRLLNSVQRYQFGALSEVLQNHLVNWLIHREEKEGKHSKIKFSISVY